MYLCECIFSICNKFCPVFLSRFSGLPSHEYLNRRWLRGHNLYKFSNLKTFWKASYL